MAKRALDWFRPIEGVSVSFDGCVYEMELSDPIGEGAMRGVMLSPYLFACVVDFKAERCPNLVFSERGKGKLAGGRWFTANLCLEGRCEVGIARRGFAVVSRGDCCISYSSVMPEEFRYPLGRYRGVELFVNTELARDGAFAIVGEAGVSLDDIADAADLAAVFSADEELNGALAKIGCAFEKHDLPRMKLAAMEFFLALGARNLREAKPRSLLTKAQREIAQVVRSELDEHIEAPYDIAAIAARFGVSASTLNTYFQGLYGESVAAYVRTRRMGEAAALLATGSTVASAAVQVGYANPSKFAAAFKRAFGTSPSEYRRAAALHAAAKGR